MRLYYLESSAWLKRYVTEAGSAWVRHLFENQEPFACCPLGYSEVSAALARHPGVRQLPSARQNQLRQDFEADWRQMLPIAVESDLLRQAAQFAWEYRLRGSDTIHLVAVQGLHHSLVRRFVSTVLVTADTELAQAAQKLQIVVTNPAEIT